MIFQQTFAVTGDQVETDDVVNIIPCSISSESEYNIIGRYRLKGDEIPDFRSGSMNASAG